MRRIYITGAAGFIGFHLAELLLAEGFRVHGFDGMTEYYDVTLKRRRLAVLSQHPGFSFTEAMLEDSTRLAADIADFAPRAIVHLAAQAGVRYSLEAPRSYLSANVEGTFNVLEAARDAGVRHLLLASTSSVYGANTAMPYRETDKCDTQVSLYAATKKATESLSHSWAHLYGLPVTAFRFFTVYGPWGRPDMALFKFVSAIERGETIEVYGMGRMRRDFTYIDDLVEAIVRLMATPPESGQPVPIEGGRDSLSPVAPWRSVNIAGGQQVELMDFIAAIETQLGRQAEKIMLPMQAGDVVATEADARLLAALIGYVPQTRVAEGVAAFVEWYRDWRQGGGAG